MLARKDYQTSIYHCTFNMALPRTLAVLAAGFSASASYVVHGCTQGWSTNLSCSALAVHGPRATGNATGLNAAAHAAGLKYFGTATDNPELTNTNYTAILNNTNQFGQVTAGNSMKVSSTLCRA